MSQRKVTTSESRICNGEISFVKVDADFTNWGTN